MGAYVYIVGGPGGSQPWKIGWTSDPIKRLAQLQTGSSVRLEFVKVASCPNASEHERELHQRLSPYRGSGEWFHLPPDAIEYVLGIIICREGREWIPPQTKLQLAWDRVLATDRSTIEYGYPMFANLTKTPGADILTRDEARLVIEASKLCDAVERFLKLTDEVEGSIQERLGQG